MIWSLLAIYHMHVPYLILNHTFLRIFSLTEGNMLLCNTKATEKTTNFQYNFLKFVDPCNKNLRTILQQIKYPEVVAQFMTDHWVNNKNITTGATSGQVLSYPSRRPEFTQVLLNI